MKENLLLGRDALILDHAIFVNGIPVHGPGLNMFATLQSFGPRSVEYFAHCLNNESRTYHATWTAEASRSRFRGIALRRLPRIVGYVYGMVFSVWAFLFRRYDVCIAVNPLNFLAARALKALGRVKRVVLYTADYSERRFNSALLDRAYHGCDLYAVRHADGVWAVSRAISELRLASGVPKERNWHIPNGPVLARFRRAADQDVARHQVVYVIGGQTREADLLSKHHFDWVFKAFETLAAKDGRIRLLLIGRGDFREAFSRLMPGGVIPKHVELLNIESREEYVRVLCGSAVGIALYDLSGAEHLRYGDSMKLREYFAAGLPSITTPGHSVADEVAAQGLGFVVQTEAEFLAALDLLLRDDERYFAIRQRAFAYAQATDKAVLVAEALSRILPTR